MRVPPQAMYVKTAEAFGANPQEIPAIEIYQALKTGVVDGQDNPPRIFGIITFMKSPSMSPSPTTPPDPTRSWSTLAGMNPCQRI